MAKKKATVDPDELNPFAEDVEDDLDDEINEVSDISPVEGEVSDDEVRLLRHLEAASLEIQEETLAKARVMAEFNNTLKKMTAKRDALLDALKSMREDDALGIQRLPGM